MVTVPVSDGKTAKRRAALASLKARCKAARVTHDAIAADRGCARTYVVNIFAGRRSAPSGFVVAAEALCEQSERAAAEAS